MTTVYAAGVVGWRRGKKGLEFVLVSREKYQDWGFPKGKLDPGEFLPETAVREVREEAGLKVKLGRKLAISSYPLPDGQTKEVHYWASKVTEKAQRKSSFKPNDEIARVEWFEPEAALSKLSYKHDQDLLRQVIELDAKRELETRAVILLRHATATPRSDWKKGEDTRPLLPQGVAEAERLVNLLDAYGPKVLMTSSWRRCRETLAPYATFKKRTLIERSQLSELGSQKGPKRLAKLVTKVVADTSSVVICSHRPALPALLQLLSANSRADLEGVDSFADLKPGSFAVLRFSISGKPKLIATERVDIQLPLR